MRAVLAEEHPEAVVSISQRGAARVPRVRTRHDHAHRRRREAAAPAYVTNIKQRLAEYTSSDGQRPVPVLRDEVQRRRAQRRGGRAPADHDRAVRAGGRRARRCADRPGRPASTGCSPCDGGGTSTDVSVVIDGEPTLTTEGSVGAYPSQDPDDRRRHRRRRRRLDRLAVAGGHAQGRAAVGRRRSRADVLRARAAPRSTVTDAHVFLGRIPPHLLGGEVPLDVGGGAGRHRRARRRARALTRGVRHRRPGDLGVEPGERAAPGHRQAWPRRPGLHADDVRRLGLAAAVPAGRHPRPRRRCSCRRTPATSRRSACSPSTSSNDYVQTHVSRAVALDPARCRRVFDALTAQAATALAREGFAESRAAVRAHRRPALLRAGLRGAGRRARGSRSTTAVADRRRRPRSTTSTGRSTATTSTATPTQQVEWVNLRVSGVGPIQRPEIRASGGRAHGRVERAATPVVEERAPASVSEPAPRGLLRRLPTGTSRRPSMTGAPTWRRATEVDRARRSRGVRLHGAAAPGLRRPRSTTASTSS